MSRYYSMHVTITGAAPERIEVVKEAARTEWEFDDWHECGGVLTTCREDRLCGGETEEEFARRLAKAIWAANAGFCQVEVAATYLEDLPYEEYNFDEDDYRQLLASPEVPSSEQGSNHNV